MNSPFPTPDGTTPATFHDFAEAQATATVRTLIAQAARPAQTELEALRVALDLRYQSLTATLAGAANIDAAPIRELVERLTHAASEEAGAAARTARTVALEEAEARLQQDRAEAQRQLDVMRAEAAAQRDADQRERAALSDAIQKATEQANAMQADRDAQLVALRAARERGEALSVERDAQTEALRVANVLAETLRTERDEQLSAALAAKEEARTVLSEQDALLEAARISNVRHARILEKAQAQVDAARAELAAAQAEAERRLEVGAREIEALRSELERVRTEMELARAEAARPAAPVMLAPVAPAPVAPAPVVLAPVEFAAALPVEPAVEPVAELRTEPAVVVPVPEETVFAPAVFEHTFEPAIAQVPEPAVERQVVQFTEQTEAASAFVSVEGYAQDSEELTQPAAVIALPESAPVVEHVAQVDPAQAMSQAISSATDLSQVLDALVDGAGTLFPRAALFVVKTKSKRLQGWRSVGFTGGAAITREFELPLATDSALTRAVTASRTIFTGDGPSAAQAGEAWTVTFPVTTGGRVVAVVHADAGARNDESAVPFNSEAALNLGHTLVRMAGERIAALTMSARAAFGSVITAAPVNEAPLAATTPFNGSNGNGNGTYGTGAAVLQHVPAAPAALDDAGRYAAQLVSEINRYSQAAAPVAASGVDQNLQERLADQIEGARAVPVAPAPSAPASALGLFDEALGKMLGGAREASVLVRPV